MYGSLHITDFKGDKGYVVDINAYHIRIYQTYPTQEVRPIYQRTPDLDTWLDEGHIALTALLGRLENQLLGEATTSPQP